MRFLSTPLAALSGCFFTWYCLEQQNLQYLRPPSAGNESEGDSSADLINNLRQELHEKLLRIRELEASLDASGSCPLNDEGIKSASAHVKDPFLDLYHAAGRAFGVLQDAATYAVSSLVGQIWSWPGDNKDVVSLIPDIQPHIERATSAFKEHLSPLVALFKHARSNLPPEIEQTAQAAMQHFHSSAEAIVEGFFEQFPQHRTSFSGVRPSALVLAALGLLYLGFWELFMFWGIIVTTVRRIFGALHCITCCWLCRRKKVQAEKAQGAPLSLDISSRTAASSPEVPTPTSTKATGKNKNKK